MLNLRLARPAQVWSALGGAIILLIAFTHLSSKGGITEVTKDWTAGISKSLMRGSVKSIMEKSEKLWEKTVQQRREIRARFPDMPFFPAQSMPEYLTWPYSVWDLIPASYNCPFEVERIGRMGDGGKWVCGMSRYEKNTKPCILYSFGVQNESSFEQEMLERTNCEIWGYDFSVSGFGPALTAEYEGRTHFAQFGISGADQPENVPPYRTIQSLMKENGHDYIDILKIDIEYFEFNALSALNAYTQENKLDFPIGQMFLELHIFKRQPITMSVFLDWWESMEYRGLRPAWTEPNLLAVTLGLEDRFPRLAEYTLLNVKDPKNKLFN